MYFQSRNKNKSIFKQYEHLRIPLPDILSATNNFATDRCIGGGGFGKVYEGTLVFRGNTKVAIKVLDHALYQGDSEFWKEVIMLLDYKHENIISLLGFCDEEGQKILIYKYASRKSLDAHLDNKELAWAQRLKICIGAAQGLAYIHAPIGSKQKLLHRDIKSSKILLDENWNALVSGFGFSRFSPANQKNTSIIIDNVVGTVGYVDPEYMERGILTKESDIYSFGMVLFEVLCGRLCIVSNIQQPSLAMMIRRHIRRHKLEKLEDIVWSNIKDDIHPESLKKFSAIAYKCLERDHKDRPELEEIIEVLKNCLKIQLTLNTNSSLVKMFQHLKINLASIVLATNSFSSEHSIGKGGFGEVFEGNLTTSKGITKVAIKRLDRSFGQGDFEFWKEIMMLSEYKHGNIISLLGFCDEKNEKILVYEHASKKSLDLHLDNKELTWVRRLEISIGAAKGLAYVHNPAGTQKRLLHRDIKSSNILIDENWNAKIADFGLSKFGPANMNNTFLITNTTVGTQGYCDPQYMESGILTKESDVYSFGVVLFELLCGRSCILNNHRHQSLTRLVREHTKSDNINEIVWCNIKNEVHPDSLRVYSQMAYKCLKRDQGKRPKMEEVVRELETCLRYQEEFEVKDQEATSTQSTLEDTEEICPSGESN